MKGRGSEAGRVAIHLLRRAISSRETVTLAIAIGFYVLFAVASRGTFSSTAVLRIMSISASELGLMALGVALLMICGEFDLSVGSVSALGALIAATLYQSSFDPFLATAIAVGGGMAAGAINGLVTVRFGIPSFITTLGTMMMWRGVLYVATEGLTVPFRVKDTHPAFYSTLLADVGGVPAPLIWFVVVAIAMVLLLNWHRFGNHVFATGGNKEAARAMGIRINRTKVICFMIVGSLAAFSGVMQVARVRGFQSLQGSDISLMAIAAVVIGGTSLFGGVGTIIGTGLGVLIITFLEFGLIMSRVSGFWYKVILGILIIVVVAINRALERRTR